MILMQTVIKHADKILLEKKTLSLPDVRALMKLVWKLGGNQINAEGSKTLLHLRWGYWKYLDEGSRSLLCKAEEAAYADYPALRNWVLSRYGKNTLKTGVSYGSTPCIHCSGSGYITCSSCAGYGYHTSSYTRTDWQGNIEYVDEQIPCSCSSGRVLCMNCGGSGLA